MRRLPRFQSASRLALAGAAAVLVSLLLPAAGHALSLNCLVPAGQAAPASSAPLRFGIYPGGGAGSVTAKAPSRAENPAKRLSALQALAGSSPFVVRLYSAWTGDTAADDVSDWLDADIASYTATGMRVELVVRYRPATAGAGSPSLFAEHVRGLVRRYGSNPGFVSLQVTNEANLAGAPDASDGAYPGAAEALVQGVIAAKDQIRRADHAHLRVGFSWAYDERPLASGQFWATLGRIGGPAFASAVDWVGLDSYPGTWAPLIPLSSLLPGQSASAVKESIRSLRDCFMPLAGLGGATAIHVAENGFPTGPSRSEELQSQVLDAMVRSVDAVRASYGVTDYRWFDLRDSSSADPSFESQYGITRDDYSPKPAFGTYRDLIAQFADHTTSGSVAATTNCRPSPVKIAVPRWKSRRPTSLVVRVGSKVVKRARRSQIPRFVRISMPSGRSSVRLKVTVRARGRLLTRVARRTYEVC